MKKKYFATETELLSLRQRSAATTACEIMLRIIQDNLSSAVKQNEDGWRPILRRLGLLDYKCEANLSTGEIFPLNKTGKKKRCTK